MNGSNKIKIYTDGGSRGNPGHAAIGIIMLEDGSIIREYSEYLGQCTNNQAEYAAIIKALELSLEYHVRTLQVYSDSQLVIRQINHLYKIKNKQLLSLYLDVRTKEKKYKEVLYSHVPRENRYIAQADALVNKCLNRMRG